MNPPKTTINRRDVRHQNYCNFSVYYASQETEREWQRKISEKQKSQSWAQYNRGPAPQQSAIQPDSFHESERIAGETSGESLGERHDSAFSRCWRDL